MTGTPGPPDSHRPLSQSAGALLLDALMEDAGALIVITDDEGHVVRVNRAFERTSGYQEDQVAGHYIWDFLLLPQSIQAVQQFFQSLTSRHFPYKDEVVLLTRDGRKRFIAWTVRLVHDQRGEVEYVLVCGVDITREKHLAADLETAATREEQLREYYELLELAQDPVAVLSPEGTVRYWNPAAETLYGWTKQEAQGQVMHELLQSHYPASRSSVMAALQQHGHWEGEVRNVTRQGKPVAVVSKLALRPDASGRPLSILEFHNDVTTLKQAEAEREVLLEELSLQRSRFEAVLQQMPLGVMVTDALTHRVSFTNTCMELLLGSEIPPGAHARAAWKNLCQADGQCLEPGPSLLQAMQEGTTVNLEDLHVCRPDGERIAVWASVSPIRNRLGETASMVLVLEPAESRWQRTLTPTIDPPADTVTPEVFLRRFGRKHAALGHPPLEGRLIALLLLSPAPVSLSEAARQLQATKGGLSKVVGEMHARGDLEVTRDPSSREHRLVLANRVYLRDLAEKQELSASVAALGYALLRDNPDLDPEVQWRVRDLANVRAQHALNIAGLLRLRHEAQERSRQAHLLENWDAVQPKTDPE